VKPVDAKDLKVGLYIPHGDGKMSPGIHRWSDTLAMAQAADRAGLDSVWVADHMIFRFDDLPTEGRWECWTMLGALAAATTNIEIGPLVSCMGFRNPALLAKMAETVDEISNGRLILGVGAGWHEPEFTSYGLPFDHRASRFEEAYAIMYGLLREGRVDFDGTYYQVENCELRPRGPRPGYLPIMVGTDGPRLLRLAARTADIWNTTWTRSVDEIMPRLEALDEACDEVGRSRDSIARSACIFLDLPGAQGVFSADGTTSTPQPKSNAEAIDHLLSYAQLGVGHLMLWLDPCTVDAVEQASEILRDLRA
jgi:alkanesulfonate monooxygenase SsuD/methylene tetrahydromethanopterin reductase-like flavin-dependent oxidoreductase (luciferase family)